MRSRHWLLAVSIILACVTAAPVAAQCCGDCNGDGRVAIDEIIGAVNVALDGCLADAAPALELRHVALPSLTATLGAGADGGRIELALLTDWAGSEDSDRVLFGIRGPQRFENRVELVKNGGFLRWIVTEAGGREVDLSLAISGWAAGAHSVVASWGEGRSTLVVDGAPVARADLGAIRLSQGDALQLGAAGVTGTTYTTVVLTTFDAAGQSGPP